MEEIIKTKEQIESYIEILNKESRVLFRKLYINAIDSALKKGSRIVFVYSDGEKKALMPTTPHVKRSLEVKIEEDKTVHSIEGLIPHLNNNARRIKVSLERVLQELEYLSNTENCNYIISHGYRPKKY